MIEKTILARLKRKWQGQEKDRIIWNDGIINFISPSGEYNPISFTCYQLYKILQDSFSYQNLYKHLRKYETEEFLTSKLITNEKNRKERIYSFSKRILGWGIHTVKYIQDKEEKVESQKLFELIQKYNRPKKIYDMCIKKKITNTNALDTLRYIIDQGSMFERQLESAFLQDALKYFVRLNKKDKSLFSYLEEVGMCHENNRLQKKAFDYILKYFPDLFNTDFSHKFEKIKHIDRYKPKSIDDYILTNERLSLFRRFRHFPKQIKDQKLLDFYILANEKLKIFRTYSIALSRGNYDSLTNGLVYEWGHVYVVYKKIKNFEQEPYENILPANLRNQNNDFWRIKDRNFYFSLKIFKIVLNIKEKDIMVAIPFLHTNEVGRMRYKSPIKIFSEKTDFIIYLKR